MACDSLCVYADGDTDIEYDMLGRLWGISRGVAPSGPGEYACDEFTGVVRISGSILVSGRNGDGDTEVCIRLTPP